MKPDQKRALLWMLACAVLVGVGAWCSSPSLEPEVTLKPGIHHPVDAPWLACSSSTVTGKVTCTEDQTADEFDRMVQEFKRQHPESR